MEYRCFGSDCVIRIQKGEEILAALRQVCTQENIVLASVNGIGAVNDVTLGVFNSKKFVYESTRYTGDMEIVSCMGNVTQKDGEVYLHLHMAVANATKGVVYAGHLNDAKISLTGEFILRIIDGRVEREYSPEVGVSRQPRMLSRVDLPDPLVPMMVTNSPSAMSNDIPRRACTVSFPTWKSRRMSWREMMIFFPMAVAKVIFCCCFCCGCRREG